MFALKFLKHFYLFKNTCHIFKLILTITDEQKFAIFISNSISLLSLTSFCHPFLNSAFSSLRFTYFPHLLHIITWDSDEVTCTQEICKVCQKHNRWVKYGSQLYLKNCIIGFLTMLNGLSWIPRTLVSLIINRNNKISDKLVSIKKTKRKYMWKSYIHNQKKVNQTNW